MLGDRLKKLRATRGLSQEQLSKHLGLSRGTYAHYEINKRQPDYDTLKKLSVFFDVSTDYLIDGKEHTSKISVAGQDIPLTEEEYKVFKELKKHPILFHDLATNPEKKIKELIKLQKMKKLFLDEGEENPGNGFGDIED
ncbi:helix-turn-helix domain-containing protein [Peribacillus sp. NPDC046944]|uniref:helix-turn-helix domain-containing protein n=1 Tax=unclassified Peribacillus TaxID=2675266 RepID=UPI003CFE8182